METEKNFKEEVNKYFSEKKLDYTVNSVDINEIFLECLNGKDINQLKLFFEYALKNNLKVNFNTKDKNFFSPLNLTCSKNNIEKVQLIIDYANKNDVVLDLNKRNIYGTNPLTYACSNNNIKMFQLLVDYANKNDIILNINEKNRCNCIHFLLYVLKTIFSWLDYLLIMPIQII